MIDAALMDTVRQLRRIAEVGEDICVVVSEECSEIEQGRPSQYRLEQLMRALCTLRHLHEFAATLPRDIHPGELVRVAAAWEAPSE